MGNFTPSLVSFSCFQGIRFNLVDRLILMDESYPWLFNRDVTRWMVGQVG